MAADTRSGTRCSLYYRGEFYDNVRIDLHGQTTAGFPKKSYDVDFNNENRFYWREGERPVRDVNLITNWTDKGKFRTSFSYEIYRESGAPYMFSVPIRIEQNGEFFSIADLVEDADDITLERLGLNPEGALYKPYDGLSVPTSSEKKTRKWEDW